MRAEQVAAAAASKPAIEATSRAGRSTCSGPLAGKVLRVSPPLVMPLDEARTYFRAMYSIFAALAGRLQSG